MKNFLNNATSISVALTAEDLRLFAQEVAEATVAALNTKNEPDTNWLTADQVCTLLGIDRSTLWRWNKEGYLTNFKFGSRVRYKESDVCRVKAAEKGGEV